MSGWLFLASSAVVFLVAVLTVSLQSLRAAMTAPMNVLRYE